MKFWRKHDIESMQMQFQRSLEHREAYILRRYNYKPSNLAFQPNLLQPLSLCDALSLEHLYTFMLLLQPTRVWFLCVQEYSTSTEFVVSHQHLHKPPTANDMPLYTNTRHICSCSTSKINQIDSDSVRENLFINNPQAFTLHNLADLYFCAQCQILKCNQCLISKIECKFCPNCLTDHSQIPNEPLHCVKNCFNCPNCSSHLLISSKTISKSKQFTFTCSYCDYVHTTGIIDKPRSLQSIVKSEMGFNSFKTFQGRLKNILEYNKLLESESMKKISAKKISTELLHKLNTLNLSNLTQKLTSTDDSVSRSEKLANSIHSINPIKLDEAKEYDLLSQRINDTSPKTSIHQSSQNQFSQTAPNPTPLMSKRSFYCSSCSVCVLSPEPSPILLKFPIKSNAIEMLPVIDVFCSQLPAQLCVETTYTCSINIRNTHVQQCTVKISTITDVPLQFFKTAESPASIKVTLPTLAKVRLGAKTETKKESLIKSIPTDYLTNSTAQSRAELMLRQGVSMQNLLLLLLLLQTNPNVSIDESFDESFDTSAIVDTLDTWALLKMKFVISGNGDLDLRIPLHISIESINLHGHPIKYKYWVVSSLGSYQVVNP